MTPLNPNQAKSINQSKLINGTKLTNDEPALDHAQGHVAVTTEGHAQGPVAGETEIAPDINVDLGERYSVICKLGEGANATAYKVRDLELDKTFAVKLLRSELVGDQTARKRFEIEAQAAANLTHANIVSVYRSGVTASDAPYLVMDCVGGETLESLLQKETQLEANRAVEIFAQVCEALVHMHMKGIVHRDLKPSNIIIECQDNGSDIVKIVDFGIAKNTYAPDTTHFTKIGEVIGSPLYMSPEQCKGIEVDGRSDIYSLGCLMFEALTGRPPFLDEAPIKVVLDHVNTSPPSLQTVKPGLKLPAGLEHIILHCLQKNPLNRYQTVDQLFLDLQKIRDGGSLAVTPCAVHPPIWRRYLAGIADGGILTLVVLILLMPLSAALHSPMPTAVFSKFLLAFCLAFPGSLFFGPAVSFAVIMLLLLLIPNILTTLVAMLIILPISLIYSIAFDASPWQGSPGKQLFGLAVVGATAERISPARALIKWFSRCMFFSFFWQELFIDSNPIQGESAKRWCQRLFRNAAQELKVVEVDVWSKTFVIQRSALSNPYIPNVSQYFVQPPRQVLQLHAKMLANKVFACMLMIVAPVSVFVSYTPKDPYVGPILNLTIPAMFALVCWLEQRHYSRLLKKCLAERQASSAITLSSETIY